MALSEFSFVVVLFLITVSVAIAVAVAVAASVSQDADPQQAVRPLVIAHRGSSGVLPEHTVKAYERAISDGADVIECDVTISRDLVPVCLHEELLHLTTDVANRSEFASRLRTITIPPGIQLTGWFSFDFTLAELKTLRKRQSWDFRDPSYDGMFTIPTLSEHIAVAKAASRPVAIYPEIKNPFLINQFLLQNNVTIRIEDIVLRVLEQSGYRTANDLCFVQCFEENALLYLKNRTDLRLVILIKDSVPDDRLAIWAQSFYAVAAWINVLAPHWTEDGGYKHWIGNNVTDFVARAHANGLKVHVWTLQNEDRFLAWDFEQDVYNAFDFYLRQKVDGMFTDFPASLAGHLDRLYKNETSAAPRTPIASSILCYSAVISAFAVFRPFYPLTL